METSKAKVSLKLLIDTKEKRVLYAEAGKDFVDFLFNLLHLPVVTVVKLLTKQAMVGSLGNLYDSIENLSETCFQPTKSKQSVLNPKTTISSSDANPLLLLKDTSTTEPKRFYGCSNYTVHLKKRNTVTSYCYRYVSQHSSALCPKCNIYLSREMVYVTGEGEEGEELAAGERGFVKGLVTYAVMDDLTVTPMSTTSSITLLNKFKIKEVGALEERTVDLGMPEGLKLLKASLHSKKVLTSVFLEDTGA